MQGGLQQPVQGGLQPLGGDALQPLGGDALQPLGGDALQPLGGATTQPMGGGAMGGLLGPGHALYQRLGDTWSSRGVACYRVGYRIPNDLDRCAHDVACAVEMAAEDGAERVVVMGHSFGGAVAIRVAVVMTKLVVGVVTFATQSGGCEVAGALAGRPLLLFHGDQDELLPMQASEMVQMIAGSGELVVCEGDGHLLGRSDDLIVDRLDAWLPDVFAGTG